MHERDVFHTAELIFIDTVRIKTNTAQQNPRETRRRKPDTTKMSTRLSADQIKIVVQLFEKFRDKQRRASRPAMRIVWEPMTTAVGGSTNATPTYADDVFASKLGGYPFWPKGHPLTDAETGATVCSPGVRGSLSLLAQFNLSELSDEDREQLHFPASGGMLQFFIRPSPTYGLYDAYDEFNGAPGFAVKLWPASALDEFRGAQQFEDAPLSALANCQNDEINYFPLGRDKPQRIRFASSVTVERIGLRDGRFTRGFASWALAQPEAAAIAALYAADEQDCKWELCCAVQEACEAETGAQAAAPRDQRLRDDSGGSKLGGNPTFTQEDPRSWAENNGGDDENENEGGGGAAMRREDYSNNELLFQLESGNGGSARELTGDSVVMIGDCGVLQFFLARASWQAGAFSAAYYNWDCS
jgi:uncharacterized protein YwqG